MVHVPTGLPAPDQSIVDRVHAAGHGHCFAWWETLASGQQRRLLDQLAAFDFDLITTLRDNYVAAPPPARRDLGPVDVIRLPNGPADEARDAAARDAGHAALAAGEVAVLLVAGGQGTRLGFDGPKGAMPITPVEHKTVFQWHAEKIRALLARYGRPLPWYIMTSAANDETTRSFFDEHAYFSLPPDDVTFFQQGMLPALGRDGRLIMEERWRVHESPNGHGGTLLALHESGALADMRRRGIVDVFYFQVDNVLTVMADPLFLGHHRTHRAEMSAKVVAKRSWDEKVGVLGTIDGRVGVIEYSDLGDADAQSLDAEGRLRYWAGNEAVHVFAVDFVERLTAAGLRLPYHRAEKRVPCLDSNGEPGTPQEKNGVKFETFVFDALGEAARTAIVEVHRERDFAPVKNAAGEDSAATARQMLCNEFGRWLEACGVAVPRDRDGTVRGVLEISPLTADSADALRNALPSGTVFADGLSL